MTNHKTIFEVEKDIHDAVKSSDDPGLADALLAYFREVQHLPKFTLLELKSLFISFNGRGQGRGESRKYPLSESHIKAFERVRELTGISTNSLEGIIRTRARATPELIKAQQERALSRQAADIISRLDKENSSLQGKVVQIYFERGLEIKELSDLVRRLLEHRLPERQEAILREYLPKEIDWKSSVAIQVSMTSDLSQLLDVLQDMQFEKLDDQELLALMSATKRAIPILEHAKKECFDEVTRRFGT
jgi:hypothetical protein